MRFGHVLSAVLHSLLRCAVCRKQGGKFCRRMGRWCCKAAISHAPGAGGGRKSPDKRGFSQFVPDLASSGTECALRLVSINLERICHQAMISRLDQELSHFRAAMNVRGHRQEVLASNIANADTPHYKARDLDFAAALSTAMGGKTDGPVAMNMTSQRHIGGAASNPFANDLKYRTEYQGAVDGNTVNMDVERASFAENAIQFEALLTVVRNRLGDLRMAMQSQ
jgi:flagellar basal-body rod protein FlgB